MWGWTVTSYGPGQWKYGPSVLSFVALHPSFSSSRPHDDIVVFRDEYGSPLAMLRRTADLVVKPLDGMIPPPREGAEEFGHA